MLHYTVKSLKTGFWVLLPLFLVSNTGIDSNLWASDNFEGSYDLEVTGVVNERFSGSAHFETTSESTNEEVPFLKLSLKLANNDLHNEHSLEFLISKQNKQQLIPIGKYEISENIDGLLDDFDGVFGFANARILGEKPFFTDKGKIVITQMSDKALRGYVSVSLVSIQGDAIYLKGSFYAVR